MSGKYLKLIRIDSFGSFFNRAIGPFSPHLNVVFGRNETGKTTVSQFVSGVLFGWEEARGNRNTYKPANADRAGALIFSDEKAGGEDAELFRARNADGLAGDASLVEDIDKDTFQTMFALDSDELRSLRDTTDMTARLLTAGSGTNASPAEALSEINERIARYTSRSANAEDSIVRIVAELKTTRAQIQAALDQTEQYKAEGREYRELGQQKEGLGERISALNEEIDALVAQRAQLGKIDEQLASLKAQADEIRADAARYETGEGADDSPLDERILSLDALEERALCDRLDELAGQLERSAHSVEVAQDDSTTSKAAYDALVELAEAKDHDRRAARQRHLQIVLSVILPLVFVVMGVPLFMHGREIASLSFSALGIGLVAFGLLLAVGALVLIFRPNNANDSLEQRIQDAQWVMFQDRKKLEGARANEQAVSAKAGEWLASVGLGAAGGSIRTARSLLDEAKNVRADRALSDQRAASYELRLRSIETSISDFELQRAQLVHESGMPGEGTDAKLDAEFARKTAQRDALIEATERVNLRYGELGKQLEQAKLMRELDEVKQHYQDLQTRLLDSKGQLARLLIARRMLESAVSMWESRSQPEVYAQASELFELMTDGAWVRVSMTGEGQLVAMDRAHNVREPRFLSLGTCQQLYLALRIALLMNADNVGRSIPILADDILVNFDAKRRKGAAKALAQLAKKRQVILFTCHEEVVDAMRSADPRVVQVDL